MKNKLNKILNSLEGIKEAKPKPYLFTRINSKIEKSIEDDILYHKIERPIVILTSIFIIILALYNFDFVTNICFLKIIFIFKKSGIRKL